MYIDVTDIKPCMWVNGFYVRVTCHVGANKIKKSILSGISDNSNQGNGTSVAGKCYDDDVIMMKSILVLPMTMTHFRYIISSWEYCFRWWRQCFVMFMRQNSFVSTCNRCTCILISSRVKPDQRNPWIKDQLWNDLLSTILHLQLPNFVSCGRDKPSHMTQNLVTVGVKL